MFFSTKDRRGVEVFKHAYGSKGRQFVTSNFFVKLL